MIETAKRTGDINRNPVTLDSQVYEQNSFYTAHFGGLYIFRNTPEPVVIAAKPTKALEKMDAKIIDMANVNAVAQFLDKTGLTEPIIDARSMDVAQVLQQKMDFMVIDALGATKEDLTDLSRSDMRRLTRRAWDDLSPAYEGLSDLQRWCMGQGEWPLIASDHAAYFYTVRSAQHEARALVNQLLAELCPLDFRQLFICHKEAFYAAYKKWPAAKKDFVATFLERDYAMNKEDVRERLFGQPEAPSELELSVYPEPLTNIGQRFKTVGPWGPRDTEDDDDDD